MMIDDLKLPAKLYVVDGEYRSWRTLWRKRARLRLIFAGYIDSFSRSGGMWEPEGVRIELCDEESRMQRKMYYTTEPFDYSWEMPLASPIEEWWEGVKP